jgi:hypothetical protein
MDDMTKRVQTPTNILMQALTEREARKVAAMLRRTGYTQAIIEDCRRRSPIEIAAYFEPIDEKEREELTKIIARTAGLQP